MSSSLAYPDFCNDKVRSHFSLFHFSRLCNSLMFEDLYMLNFCQLNHIQVQRGATQSGFQLQRDCSCNNRSNTIYQQFASLSTCNVITISYSFITRKSARYSRGFISLEMTICWRFQDRPPTPVLYRHISRNCLLESTGRLTHSWFEMLFLLSFE